MGSSSLVFYLERTKQDWGFRSFLSASIDEDFRLSPYESPYNSSS
jgi:hypothetical protein